MRPLLGRHAERMCCSCDVLVFLHAFCHISTTDSCMQLFTSISAENSLLCALSLLGRYIRCKVWIDCLHWLCERPLSGQHFPSVHSFSVFFVAFACNFVCLLCFSGFECF